MRANVLYACLILSGVGLGLFGAGTMEAAAPRGPEWAGWGDLRVASVLPEGPELALGGLLLASLFGFSAIFLMPLPRGKEPRL